MMGHVDDEDEDKGDKDELGSCSCSKNTALTMTAVGSRCSQIFMA